MTSAEKNGQYEVNDSNGWLTVQVFAAERAIPVKDATVIISEPIPDGREKLIRILKTDASGVTPTVELPAPPQSNSLAPGNRDNFSVYNIRVDSPGYYTVENINVPVFSGNKSVQPVELLPLADGEERGKRIIFSEEERTELE